MVNCVSLVPNVPVFFQIDDNRAAYQYTNSNLSGVVDDYNYFFDSNFMTKPMKWSEIKSHSVIIPNFSYSEINKYISKKEIKK